MHVVPRCGVEGMPTAVGWLDETLRLCRPVSFQIAEHRLEVGPGGRVTNIGTFLRRTIHKSINVGLP